MEAANMVRRATDRTGEQIGDAFLNNRVGFWVAGRGSGPVRFRESGKSAR